ncbi:hypothetical protein [Prochlorococcus sp. MIT 1341]|uniref:hypothetical protein n=1 Tax=Prochlorococcus sp. MIT 1341 TaxID=3096221 RepID=UPI002A748E97|nr:hypothetical protein [Prochlorococcus sp. MIT 1341]
MHLKSLSGCRLAISSYPSFLYDATGGGGEAVKLASHKVSMDYFRFCPDTFSMPDINWSTTRFIGLRIPPGLEIKMYLDKLEGYINKLSGEISLQFESRFVLTVFSKISAPELIVRTCLHTGKASSKRHLVEGMTLQDNGRARLIGVAEIEPTGSFLLDSFLNLPDEALAILECEFKY